MTGQKKSFVFGICFLALVVLGGFLVGVSSEGKEFLQYEDHGVPILDLSLKEVELAEIDEGDKEIKYGGNEMKIWGDGEELAFSNVEIKGRGNGTRLLDKKPYQIKLEKKANLLGMGEAKKWYLLANAMDGTSLRTEMAFYMEDMLGMKYKMEGEAVELYVNGEYRGLYYLTQAVEARKNRVDLRDSLGVLVELDNLYWEDEISYSTRNGDILTVKDAVDKDKESEAMAEFLRAYNEFEIAVFEKDYEKITELVDVDSFVQYYLLSEFSVNPDAYWTSFYMYKDGSLDKIHAGPGWDFDLAFANRVWENWMGERFYSPTETMIRRDETRMSQEFYEIEGIKDGYEISLAISRIMYDLMEVPEFTERVAEVFRERMSGREEEFLAMMYRERDKIWKALTFDEEKWKSEGSWEEFSEMVEWVKRRYEYFEELYGGDGVYVDDNDGEDGSDKAGCRVEFL